MNIRSKAFIVIAAIILIILITYYFLFPVMIKKIWKATHKDIKDVTIEGYVYDTHKNALDNYTLYITNYYYGESADESYQSYDLYTIITDTNGYYSIKLTKSSYVQIDYINVKEGPSSSFIDKNISKQKNE